MGFETYMITPYKRNSFAAGFEAFMYSFMSDYAFRSGFYMPPCSPFGYSIFPFNPSYPCYDNNYRPFSYQQYSSPVSLGTNYSYRNYGSYNCGNYYDFNSYPTTRRYTYTSLFDCNCTKQNTIKDQSTKINNGTNRPKAARKLGKDFLEAVKGVAERINCDYKDLLAVMNGESGLNPATVNKKGGATGLIQFMPKTAKSLGTTTSELKNMSAIEQLPYVEEYLKRCKKIAGFDENEKLTGGDLYALIFLPGRAKREILCEKGEEGNKYYEYNSPTDLNKDGKITKSELQKRIENKRVDETIFA